MTSQQTPFTLYQQQLYASSPLTSGQHMLTVTSVSVDGNTTFWFDYLEVISTVSTSSSQTEVATFTPSSNLSSESILSQSVSPLPGVTESFTEVFYTPTSGAAAFSLTATSSDLTSPTAAVADQRPRGSISLRTVLSAVPALLIIFTLMFFYLRRKMRDTGLQEQPSVESFMTEQNLDGNETAAPSGSATASASSGPSSAPPPASSGPSSAPSSVSSDSPSAPSSVSS